MDASNSFLRSLAVKCYKKYGDQADQLTIVFPNKRAGLFFRKYLSEVTEKPIWSPSILSIEDFILSMSPIQLGDQSRLLFALYSIYRKKIKNSESFDSFYHWGEMILNDFNDIDNYLVDPEHIFRTVKSQKELDEAFYYLPEEDQKTIQSFWASFLPKPTKSQTDFLKTWEVLNVLYQEFNGLLSQKNISYKGRIYREVAGQIEQEQSLTSDKVIWFAGFNALTKTEESIIKYYVKEKNAELFWDIDSYYLDDHVQEAGLFFRQYMHDPIIGKSIKRDEAELIIKRPKDIAIHSAALSMNQVKAVGEQLADLSSRTDFLPEETVVILPDENLLLPMLNSIPKSIEQINVTMGYPIKNSNYFNFFSLLADVIAQFVQTKEEKIIKAKLILDLLNHSIFQITFPDIETDFKEEILKKNRNFITYGTLKIKLPKLFTVIEESQNAKDLLETFLDLVSGISNNVLTTLDGAVTHELYKLIVSIQQSIDEFDLKVDVQSLAKLFTRMGTTKVPFSGEPLSGLQIMGTLETRNLDFRNVFILDMNEDIWPKDSSTNSFIPYNIRKAFDLPVIEQQDAIQSYLFYRLLHRADSINIYHNNISEFNHSGELSRYVKQIQMESGLEIRQYAISDTITLKPAKAITIAKNEQVNQQLSKYFVNKEGSKRLSPSALNTFLDCRLKFYFKYIERVQEKEELNEMLDPATFGNLLHNTMEFFYQDIIDQKKHTLIEASDLKSPNVRLKRTIEKAFEQENRSLKGPSIYSGQQVIASRVIEKFAMQILKHDQEHTPFDIYALEAGQEDGYTLDVPIVIDGNGYKVGLKGIIDRIDKKDGLVRILDYKSGGDERKFTTIEALFDRQKDNRNKAVMQVFLYCLFYVQNNSDEGETILPGIFNSKDLFSGKFSVKINQSRKGVIEDFIQVQDEYLNQLMALLEDMFDPKSPFDQTEHLKKCEFCPYSGICMRN